jgi:hypothetical protein
MDNLNDRDPELPGADQDNPQRLLILAYTRLFLLPERDDGSKLTAIASFGRFEVRLIEVQELRPAALAPLWVELYDHVTRCVLDSAGCRDLQDAGSATETFIDAARRLSGLTPSEREWDRPNRD